MLGWNEGLWEELGLCIFLSSSTRVDWFTPVPRIDRFRFSTGESGGGPEIRGTCQ